MPNELLVRRKRWGTKFIPIGEIVFINNQPIHHYWDV